MVKTRRVLGPHNFAVRLAMGRDASAAGRLHLVWIAANSPPGLGSFPPPPNPVMAAYSDDGGITFSAPVQVSDPRRSLVVAPAVTVGPAGSVHVAYFDLGDDRRDYHGLAGPTWDGQWSVVLASSGDGGRTFGAGSLVDGAVVPTGRVMLIFTMPAPAIAAGPGRRVFVAWPDARHGDPDVLLRQSEDGGRSWAEPVRLNDDPPGNGRVQDLPRLAVAPNGRVDAVFYDRRDDPDNRLADVRYTSSSSADGGLRFRPTVRITSTAFPTQVGQRYVGPAAEGLVEFGSRLGLVSRRDGVVVAWTDTRNAVHPVQQDIFATTVSLPGRGPTGARWAGLAAVALVVGAGGLIIRRRGPQSLLATGLAALLAASSSGCARTGGVPLPPQPAIVDVGMAEHRFDYRPFIPPGRVIFRVANYGGVDHQLLLARLPEDLPPLNEQLHSEVRRALETLRILSAYTPGAAGAFAVNLAPGRYGLLCFLQEPGDTVSHALKGMNSEFRVG